MTRLLCRGEGCHCQFHLIIFVGVLTYNEEKRREKVTHQGIMARGFSQFASQKERGGDRFSQEEATTSEAV